MWNPTDGTVVDHQEFRILFQTAVLFRWFDHNVAGSFIGCWKGKTNVPKRSWKQFVLLWGTATSDLLWWIQRKQTAHSAVRGI